MPLSRREFLFLGGAAGATAAAGVVVPIAISSRNDRSDGGSAAPPTTAEPTTTTTTTTTTEPPTGGEEMAAPVEMAQGYPRVKVASMGSLEVDTPVMFEYPLKGQSNMLVKLGRPARGGIGPDGDVVAYSNQCTHMGCVLTDYDGDHKVLGPCPCHFTTFDLTLDGEVTLGHATEKLPRVILEMADGDIFAVGVDRLIYGHDDNLAGGEPVA
ncbi:MAG TPA: arsenate reductase (azurin) small subunit [Acidimicrobiales bacterium]|nr:arsenate reductase (azurin) small subunit [Acidimicrobiales bacterium]